MRKSLLIAGWVATVSWTGLAHAAEFLVQPIRSSGTQGVDWTLVGNEIRLAGGGKRVFLEVKIRNYAPNALKTYQATLNAAGYTSGTNGTIIPAVESCPSANAAGHTFCRNAFSEPAGIGATECRDSDPGPAIVLRCQPGWLNTGRSDFVFAGLAVQAFGTDISTPSYRWGATLGGGDLATDEGSIYYAGSWAVDVPSDAAGTFTIGFTPGVGVTFMANENNDEINPLLTSPGRIVILCTNAAQCNDNNFCTDDTCNAQGVCSNTPNYNVATQCCDRDDPNLPSRLETISDGNECTDDSCDTNTGDVSHQITPGEDCGPPGQPITQCNLQDTCDANGQCQTNILDAGTSCGSTNHTDCDFADTCNATGTCLSNIQPQGTLCETHLPTGPCDDANTCNASGTCLDNFHANNSVCDDSLFCTDNTRCNATGECGAGVPHDCSDSQTCTTDTCVEDSPPGTGHCESELNPGQCLIDGSCYAAGTRNPDPAENCEVCDPSGLGGPNDWSTLPDGTDCNDGNACTGTGRVGIDDDTCTAGVCLGELDPQCNDQCEFAVPAVVGPNLSTNASAGDDGGTASCQVNTHADVWFKYTALCDGAVFISTTGSQLLPVNDPVLNVYSECPLAGGIEIACDDDSGDDLNAALIFATVQGEDYFIRVSAFDINRGLITLNLSPFDDCLIGGVCYFAGDRNPGNDCEACIPQISTTDWSLLPEGTFCGDPADTECSSPDACGTPVNGVGDCEQNHKTDGTLCSDDGNECTKNQCDTGECAHPAEPAGLLCGDQLTDTDCDNPDTCDGNSNCLDNLEGPGFACGDPTTTQCDNPDTCDGAGVCELRYVADGTLCDDDEICTEPDACQTGLCVGTAIPVEPVVEAISGRHLEVTPQPSGDDTAPVALHVTSPDWPCLDQWINDSGALVPFASRVFHTAADWGTILVNDPDIVPSSTYEVVAVCGTYESAPGSDDTYLWGDLNNDGVVDFEDIALLVDAFKGRFLLPLETYDLYPCPPSGHVDFSDIAWVVDAFQGEPYPCSLPCHD